MPPHPSDPVAHRDESGPTQTLKAIMGLRGMVIDGRLRPGERVLEQRLVDELGVSRTPVRAALARVCEEGLLEQAPGGRYVVATFSEADVLDAICIRGTLEGMAARLAAERGVPAAMLGQLKRCVVELDDELAALVDEPDLTHFMKLNDRFHELLLNSARSPMLKRSVERLAMLPFATPNAFATVAHPDVAAMRKIFTQAQEDHRNIIDAIEHREGSRAESLSIEHARVAWKYLRLIFDADHDVSALPGLSLITRAL